MASKPLSPAAARKVGLGLLIASLIFATLAAYSVGRTVRFLRTAERVSGTVIELERRSGNKGSTTFAPIFRFTDKSGVEHTVTSKISSSPPDHSVGDTVDILYDPNDIAGAEARGFSNWFGTLFFSIFATVTGFIGTVFFFVSKAKPKLDPIAAVQQIKLPPNATVEDVAAYQAKVQEALAPLQPKPAKQLSPRGFRILAVCFLLASFFTGFLTILFTARTINFLRTAERVPGIVAELIPRRGNKGGTTWAPRFEFVDKTGKSQSVVSSSSSSPAAYSEGENVEILYDPNDIKGAETRGIGNWLGTIIPGIFCLVLGGISIAMLLKNRRPKYT